MSTETIDDLIVLGRAHPEPISDNRRHTVCVGGYSPSEGFIRLYPTRMQMEELTRWNIVSVEVTESADDHRDESYKIAGSDEEWDRLFEKVEKVGELQKSEQIKLIDQLCGDCTAKLNEEHKSLGIVKPGQVNEVYIDEQEETPVQIDLIGRELLGKNDFSQKLYIEYECEDCGQKTPHNQHVIEWGVYEFWKKNDDPTGVIDALHMNDDDWSHYFFVGNLRHQPTAYIIISVIRFKQSDMIDAGVRPEQQKGLSDF